MGLNASPSLPNMQQTVDIILRMRRHPLLVITPEHEAYVNELEKFIKVTVRAVRIELEGRKEGKRGVGNGSGMEREGKGRREGERGGVDGEKNTRKGGILGLGGEDKHMS